MIRLIRQYPIWAFLVLNYIISWSFLYPSYQLIKGSETIPPLAFIGLIGAYGPTIAAIIIQAITDRKKLRSLFKKLIQVKTRWTTILFIVLAPILLYIAAYLIAAVFFDGNTSIQWTLGLSNIHIWFLLALPFGPMGEELGWRGYMLPKLMERYSMLKSTLFVGLAWGVWHLASFTFPGAAIPSFLEVNVWTVLLYFTNTIALSMVFTYVYLRTSGSVSYAILLHAFFNAASNVVFDFFGETDDTGLQLAAYIINILLAGICGYLLIRKHQKRDLNRYYDIINR